jgi:pimeloyl-ACP methyl ester carboxylesterase
MVCPPAALLLFSVVTTQGAIFALGALLLGIVPLLAWMKPDKQWLRIGALASLLAWLGITAWLLSVSPSGRPPAGSRVENRYVGGAWHYPRTALGSLLPEVDQFMMGFKLVPLLDSLFTYEQARAVSEDTRKIYAALEADPDFHALGSVMPEAYQDLRGTMSEHGHYFLYVPPSIDRKKAVPALMFLHGSGGNFKSYTWLLSKVADECDLVLIAPTCGFGNWDARSPKFIDAVLSDAAKAVPIDLARVHLAGLSNGGLGVTRAVASEHGNQFRSLILLSPVTDEAAISSPAFSDHCKGKPVLVITGEADDRVPWVYVRESADAMHRAGALTSVTASPQADHFLCFSHRDRCLNELSQWLKAN